MPLYEYRCSKCDHTFEELVFGGERPACPSCHDPEPEKLMSAHSVGSSGSTSAALPPSCGSCPSAGAPGCGLS